jgi:hypothetical protein
MKHLIIPAVISVMSLVSCTSTYRAGETPDDVYYSPNPVYAQLDEEEDNNRDSSRNYSDINRGNNNNNTTTIYQPYDPYYNSRDVYYYDPRCACYVGNTYGTIYAPTVVVTPSTTPKAPSKYIIPQTARNTNSNQYNNTNRPKTKAESRYQRSSNSSNYNNNNNNYNNNNNNNYNNNNSNSNNNNSSSGSSGNSSSGSSSSGSSGNAPVRTFPK